MENKLIIDYIENIETEIYEEKMALARLSQGIFWLYTSVLRAENKVRNKAKKDNTLVAVVSGSLGTLNESIGLTSPLAWLSCAFQWYAVSVVNYAKLIGWISYKDHYKATDYVKQIIPRLHLYRNKVAAHFAYSSPMKENVADLSSSIMTSIVYAHGYLRAGAYTEIVADEKGNEIEAENKMSWSLTKTHKQLVPRFWKSGPIPAYDSIKVDAGQTRKFHLDWSD